MKFSIIPLSLIYLFLYSTLFAQMTVEDKDSNILLEIKDEGSVGSLLIPKTNTAPISTTNKLYNLGGSLNWNGSPLIIGGSLVRWNLVGNNMYTNISGNLGIGTTSPSAKLHVDGNNGVVFTGEIDNGTIPMEGSGVRMMWYPKKAAFRVGSVPGDQWDDANIGDYSIAMGYNTIAKGYSAIAMGFKAEANGNHSTAKGYSTRASGNSSTAMGWYTTASGGASIAMGNFTTAKGDYSTTIGSFVEAVGHGSFAIGDNSTSTILYAQLNNQFKARFANGFFLYTSSAMNVGAKLGAGQNSWSTLSDSTKKENNLDADGEYFLRSISKMRLGSWNYKNQDPINFRHYGPMAQEIFHYFGKDEFGNIGNDTTLATADMDGIMMIAIKALEKRTKEQQERLKYQEASFEKQDLKIKELEEQNSIVITLNTELRKEIEIIKKAFAENDNRLNHLVNKLNNQIMKDNNTALKVSKINN